MAISKGRGKQRRKTDNDTDAVPLRVKEKRVSMS